MTKNLLITLAVVAILILAGLYMSAAEASRYGDVSVTNNYPASMTIIEGVSDKDLAEGLAGAAAVGSHVFLNTYDWQGSVTGAYSDGENAISGAIGKKWKNHPNVFLHIRYTDILNTTAFGATFRF
jgi:hypothetical protein